MGLGSGAGGGTEPVRSGSILLEAAPQAQALQGGALERGDVPDRETDQPVEHPPVWQRNQRVSGEYDKKAIRSSGATGGRQSTAVDSRESHLSLILFFGSSFRVKSVGFNNHCATQRHRFGPCGHHREFLATPL